MSSSIELLRTKVSEKLPVGVRVDWNSGGPKFTLQGSRRTDIQTVNTWLTPRVEGSYYVRVGAADNGDHEIELNEFEVEDNKFAIRPGQFSQPKKEKK